MLFWLYYNITRSQDLSNRADSFCPLDYLKPQTGVMLSFLTNNHHIVMLSFLKQVGDRLELMGKLRPKFGSVFFRLPHHSYVKFFGHP